MGDSPTISKNATAFVVGVDDEKLAEDADIRMQKKYVKNPNINGQDVFKELFIASLNNTIKGSLKAALLSEKLDLRERYLALLQTILSGTIVPFFYAEGDRTGVILNASVYMMVTAGINASAFQLRKSGNKSPTARYENNIFLPTLPIDSYTRGRLYLAMNGRTLVSRVNSYLSSKD